MDHYKETICVSINDQNESVFVSRSFIQNNRNGMFLTDQIQSINFRFRMSEPGYKTDWHVTNDPTLIIIQKGTLRITLQNGEYKDFIKGQSFIVEDSLPQKISFDNKKHGHKAEVIGVENVEAIHLKLSKDYL